MALNYNSNCSTLSVGCYLYNGPNLTNPVSDGYYSDGTDCYTVTGGSGYISSISSCTVSYDYYLADVYDCSGCTLSQVNYPVAFAAGSSVITNRFYIANGGPDGFVYQITGNASQQVSYILTTSFGSFTSCGIACSA